MNTQEREQLTQLIFVCLDGLASREQMDRLEEQLAQNAEALEYYRQFVILYSGLHKAAGPLLSNSAFVRDDRDTREASTSSHAPLKQPMSVEEEQRVSEIEHYAEQQLRAFLEEKEREERVQPQHVRPAVSMTEILHTLGNATYRTWTLCRKMIRVAAICLIVVLPLMTVVGYHLQNRVVATLQMTHEADWAEPVTDTDLRPGWLMLRGGFAKLECKGGAQVILEAPCELRLKSPKRVFLENGKVTVKVPNGMRGFTVLTPTAGLVDYGTEFGVSVEEDGETESHVFSGQVKVRAGQQRHLLKAGMAVRVDKAKRIRLIPLRERLVHFVRQLPKKNEVILLDLAHVVGGGNGLQGNCPNRALDPSTGNIHESIAARSGEGGLGDHQYHKVVGFPFVDGVFVPDGNQTTVVSSAGHIFSDCPPTTNRFWMDIGVTVIKTPARPLGYELNLDGRNYCIPGSPGINVHANVGITFDLQAIRAAFPDKRIVEFKTTCGVSNGEFTVGSLVDLFVLLDGQKHFSALGWTRGQYQEIRLPLNPENRFLTLVCADGGNTISGDYAVFGEPVLLLQAIE